MYYVHVYTQVQVHVHVHLYIQCHLHCICIQFFWYMHIVYILLQCEFVIVHREVMEINNLNQSYEELHVVSTHWGMYNVYLCTCVYTHTALGLMYMYFIILRL